VSTPKVFKEHLSARYGLKSDVLVQSQGICQTIEEKNSELRILVRFIPDSLTNWQNLFQTADLNNGMRLEIDKSGSITLIVANDASGGFQAISGGRTITPGREHQVRIILTANKVIQLQVDGKKSGTLRLTYLDLCTRVRVGIGYSDKRAFLGKGSIIFTSGEEEKYLREFPYEKLFGQIIVAISVLLIIRRKIENQPS
jgi:hypothetical protein